MAAVLDGIRVLDFGRYIAGPYCATLLGDLGAEVIRIEKVRGSEDRYLLPVAETGEGAMFLLMNRNKLGMTLNPMKEEGREIVRQLVATADVVVANLPYESLQAMGLDHDSLKAVKEDIILTTVSAFGSEGPYAKRVGFDGIAQVMCGSVYLGGYPGQPVKSEAPWVDFGTASLSAFATLAALIERGKTGRGQMVEGALLRTALTFHNSMLVEQALVQKDRQAIGNRGYNGGPSDIFQTQDGWIIVQTIGAPLFKRWCDLMGEDHWLSDPRFKDDDARGDNGEVISERMGQWTAERTTAEALAALEEARIPAGPLYTPQQALEDPHIQATGFLQPVEFPGTSAPAPLAQTPVKLSETPGEIRRRAPVLGEHTDQILHELGYTDGDIAALRESRVV
ncbi:MAG: CoA transferase [Alphaproteobacteria bacterium]|jgi:crotonobetainyl-CoA:carnitine CoA-transferase CaiB-like acyl-CoA transferase|nr:CoA transferase [Alphaproteobacteria bacterium]